MSDAGSGAGGGAFNEAAPEPVSLPLSFAQINHKLQSISFYLSEAHFFLNTAKERARDSERREPPGNA